MTIAIHISTGKNESVKDSFHFKCFTKLAAEQSTHHFIFFFDKMPADNVLLPLNSTPVIVYPALQNNLLLHYWYNFRLPALLDRYNADVFFTARGCCSLRTSVPQCMVLDALSFAQNNRGPYWKKFLPKFLEKAKAICSTNKLMEDELLKKYRVQKDKVTLSYPGLDENYLPAEGEQSEQVKEIHTGGKDFFLFEADADTAKHLITVLKSFSLFKKWQKSNMQLVVLLKSVLPPALHKEIATYKYRNELLLISHNETEPTLISAAYAVLILPAKTIPETGLLAMKCGVPVISLENLLAKTIFSDAAAYCSLHEKDISNKMMLLYKDEHLRNSHIKKGSLIAAQYAWQNTTDTLWSVANTIAKP